MPVSIIKIKVCPKCGLEKKVQGFYLHEKFCNSPPLITGDGKLNQGKVLYPKQKEIMTQEQYERYVRKSGIIV